MKPVHSRFHEHFPEFSPDPLPKVNKSTFERLFSTARKINQEVACRRSKRLSNATALLYERRRKLAKQTAQLHRNRMKACRRQEKEHKRQNLGGMVWGYDPMAGRRHAGNELNTSLGCYIFRDARIDNDVYGPEEVDALRRRTGKFWHQGSTWGIECGGPGRPAQFEPVEANGSRVRGKSKQSASP